MGLSAQHCQRLAHVGVAGFIVVTSGGSLAAAAVFGSAAALGASVIGGFLKKLRTKDPTNADAIERVAEKIEGDARWASVFSDENVDMDAVTLACDTVAKYGAIYWPSEGVVARVVGGEGDWPDAVAAHVIDAIAAHEPTASFLKSDEGDAYARAVALKAVAAALSAALTEDEYYKTLEPHLMMETLGVVGEVRAKLDDFTGKFADYQNLVRALQDDLLARLDDIQDGLFAIDEKLDAHHAENRDGHEETHKLIRDGDYRSKLVDAVIAGEIGAKEATLLGSALAGERYVNPPPVSEVLPTGPEPAEEFIREFVELATSRDARERKAAALDAQGKTEEALALLEELAEEESAQAAMRWKARGALAFNSYTVKAIDSYERAVGCNPNDAEAHNQLGLLYNRLGHLDRAQRAYEHVLALGNQSADKQLISVAYGNLGLIEITRGNLDAAESYHKKSLALEEELGRKGGMASQYGNLGLIEMTRGNLDAAESYLKKSLALNKELGRKQGEAGQYGNLGVIEMTRGNLDAAEVYHKKSLVLEEALGRTEGMASAYGNLGLIKQACGNRDSAEAYHKKSLVLEEALGHKEGMAKQYGNLGLIEQSRGNLDAAESYLKKSLALDEALGRKEGMWSTYCNLGVIEMTRGNLDAAEVYLKKSLALNEALDRKEGMATQYANLGGIEQTRGHKDEACAYWRQSYDLFVEIGMPHRVELVGDWMREAGCPDAPPAEE